MPSDAAILDTLAEHRVPCAPVLSVADTIGHPHFVERGMVRKVPDEVIEDGVIIPGFPIKSSELPSLPELWTSYRGQDNTAVLQDSLGYSDAQIQELCDAGVLHAESGAG
jgi:CoA:oxalate CoA-transferase